MLSGTFYCEILSHGETLLWQNRLPSVAQVVTASRSCPGERKTHVNCNRCQTVELGRVNPGVNDLPRAKQLPPVHVKRPKEWIHHFQRQLILLETKAKDYRPPFFTLLKLKIFLFCNTLLLLLKQQHKGIAAFSAMGSHIVNPI